jgi:hypothetical protein
MTRSLAAMDDIGDFMVIQFHAIYEEVRHWLQSHGIEVTEQKMESGKAGEFNGFSVAMNSSFPLMDRTFYLVHALGSIVRWSLSHSEVQAMFDELREAKKKKDPQRLERAIERYRSFEIESSEFAVWLLEDLRHGNAAPSYTNFMCADLEALTIFHLTGRAPVWQDFFASWNEEVATDRRHVAPFHPKSIPNFRPQRIETQEILQEQGK